MKKTIILKTVLVALLFCSCGTKNEMKNPDVVFSASEATTEEQDTVKEERLTIADYREKLATLSVSAKEDDQVALLKCYGDLRARQALEKSDYAAYSALCVELGENRLGYEILEEEYRLYPYREVLDRLTAYTVQLSDAEAGELAGTMRTIIKDLGELSGNETSITDAQLRETILSPEWKSLFQFDNGTIEKKSKYTNSDYTMQVMYQNQKVQVCILENGASYRYFWWDNGETLLEAIKGEGVAPTFGDVLARRFTTDGVLYSELKLQTTSEG